MPPKRRLTKEDYPKIIERLKTSETYASIAASYDLSRERIRQIAKRNGLEGNGLKVRGLLAHERWLSKMGKRYGDFFDGTNVNEKDLLAECKIKYTAKKANSKRTGKRFEIEFQDIIWNKICPITGIEIDYFSEGVKEESPSFDCVDPSKGYVKGNVQIISWRANRIKNNGTAEEHYRIANYMTTFVSQV